MSIKLFLIGRTNDDLLKDGMSEYTKRLSRYTSFTIDELQVKSSSVEVRVILQKEAEKLLEQIKNTDFLILLDETGEEYTSIDFARKLEQWQIKVSGNIVFAVGGAYGFHPDVYKRANFKMALSKMTFTHQMVRLIFVEQLYRAFTIIRNEKYHH